MSLYDGPPILPITPPEPASSPLTSSPPKSTRSSEPRSSVAWCQARVASLSGPKPIGSTLTPLDLLQEGMGTRTSTPLAPLRVEGLAVKNHLHHPTSPLALQTSLHIPIEQIPLGARIPTKNPKPWEYDDSLPEPDQATWAKVSITMHRNDGGIVDAELLRPRWWIAQHNIVAGKHLPMNIEELQVHGSAIVTAVDECPEIASGEGSVVTARFTTREVNTIARAEIIGPDGTIETISGPPIHPIWSVDRNDWVPLGELTEGETLQAAGGIATVLSLALVTCSLPVYNIEVHGEHVYQVGELGLLVHNSDLTCSMLGLDDAKYVVDGTIHVIDDVAYAYINRVGLQAGVESGGVGFLKITQKLMDSAKNMGAKSIFAEAEIKERSGKLISILHKQGWNGYQDSFKVFLMKDL
ncbi:polymorphic toxin-type HINT domain-containing protein [Pirellulaceae bacterium SH449]